MEKLTSLNLRSDKQVILIGYNSVPFSVLFRVCNCSGMFGSIGSILLDSNSDVLFYLDYRHHFSTINVGSNLFEFGYD